MSIKCDFCDALANLHICDRCYNIAKRVLEIYEEKEKEEKPISKVKKKRGRPKKQVEKLPPKRRGRPKKQVVPSKEENKIETKTEKEEETKDPMLSPCWTCEFGFLGAGGKVDCTEGKEPNTCGRK